ncbi:MAG TPA: phage holin family protein [Sphingomonas sp.]
MERIALPALIARLFQEAQDVGRAEIRLARGKLLVRLRAARNGLILLVAALVIVFAALVGLVVGLVLQLAALVGGALAGVIVLAGGLVIAGLLGLIGGRLLSGAKTGEKS